MGQKTSLSNVFSAAGIKILQDSMRTQGFSSEHEALVYAFNLLKASTLAKQNDQQLAFVDQATGVTTIILQPKATGGIHATRLTSTEDRMTALHQSLTGLVCWKPKP